MMLARPAAEMDAKGAAAVLRDAAAKGGLAAARQLAVLKALGLGAGADWNGAVDLVAAAAHGGHPGALRELAMLGLFCGAPISAAKSMLRTSALRGDAPAAILGLRLGGVFSATEASRFKSRCANSPLIDRANGDPGQAAPLAAPHIDACANAARSEPQLSPREKILHAHAPRIAALDRLLPRAFCDYIVLLSDAMMRPSAVVDSIEGRASHAEFRTSDGGAVGVVDLDLCLFAIHRALSAVCGFGVANSELMGVLRYRPGQEYKPHFDFLPADANDYSEVSRTGQRTATLILLLDDAFEGGATIFPRLRVQWRGAAGDAVFFQNTDDRERPFQDSLHAGTPVTRGEKRVLTLWFRARRFWFWD